MRMPAQRLSDEWTGNLVALGPCPGCQLWQLEYTDAVAGQYAMLTPTGLDLSAWYQVIEEALAEHLNECPHLQAIIDEL